MSFLSRGFTSSTLIKITCRVTLEPAPSYRQLQTSRDSQWLANVIADHSADSSEVCILEVDLDYPAGLHDAHNA